MSTKLSSQNLTHFTKLEYLKKILLDNCFYARYSKEDVYSIVFGKNEPKQFIPMVCFCDIPLTLIENHCKHFNSYGIGLSKDWAILNKITPVVYCHKDSALIRKLNKYQKENEEFEKNTPSKIKTILEKIEVKSNPHKSLFADIVSKQISNFKNSVLFLKPIKGDTKRDGIDYPDVNFYNEKEWRFIPDFKNPPIISEKGLTQNKVEDIHIDFGKITISNIDDYNNYISSEKIVNYNKYKLYFDIEQDLKYLILKNDSDIADFISFLNTNCNNLFPKKTQTEIEICLKNLYSKIFTIDQLNADF
jgi:hypothetical protein